MGYVSTLPPREAAIRKELDSCVDQEAQNFIVNQRMDLRAGWDRIFLGTGPRGVGKSTLFIILSKLIDYYFHFGRLAFAPDEIIPIFNAMPEFSSMQMDEGAEILSRQDWMTSISKDITKQIVGDRYLHSFRGVLAPTIYHFNQQLIEMADYWIRVETPDGRLRGYAEVRRLHPTDYVKKKIPYAPAIYDLEFDDLPKEIAIAYQKIKAEKGLVRSERYAKSIDDKMYGKKSAYISPEIVAAEVKEDPHQFMTDDKYDWRKIYREYQREGFGRPRCKDVAYLLNLDLDKEQ